MDIQVAQMIRLKQYAVVVWALGGACVRIVHDSLLSRLSVSGVFTAPPDVFD